MRTYYNEFDPFAADWLEALVARRAVTSGHVDRRSIEDVRADELGDAWCHFFAGIGGWDYALQLAGWPRDVPVWTASLPCQPFSCAGQQRGIHDKRHLWPVFLELVAKRLPPIIFGEQVASPAGRAWLATVRTNLEALGYAVGAADLCAASVGAPHIRQRLYWVAYRLGTGLERHAWHEDRGDEPGRQCQNALRSAAEGGVACRLADSNGDRRDERQPGDGGGEEGEGRAHRDGVAGCGELGGTGTIDSPWREADWLFCRDGKWRPVEPGTFPLAARTSTRVGRLRGYGNAIVPRLAAEFILSTIEALRDSGAEQPKRT